MTEQPSKTFTYADTGQRQKVRLLLYHLDDHPNCDNPIWKRSTSIHPSAFFDLSATDITISAFKIAARAQISTCDGLGMVIHQSSKRRLIEIIFASELARDEQCLKGISVDKVNIPGWAALRPTDTPMKISLKGLPFMTHADLETKLRTFEQYGTILEAGIFTSLGWFEGEGYVFILPHDTDIPIPPIIDSNTDFPFYASWAAMPKHCTYCKSTDHTILTCKTRNSKAARRCWTCNNEGHLHRACPERHRLKKNTSTAPPFNKRTRYAVSSDSSVSSITSKTNPPVQGSTSHDKTFVENYEFHFPRLQQSHLEVLQPTSEPPSPCTLAQQPPELTMEAEVPNSG